ncbi:MAG TPA: trehalase family glycosidase [Planctomycetota bacterium]|nr:trehalase family glycosidase [Planctomycetota bacterium]
MNQKKKLALGGGGYCLYAPRFPRFHETPGFADEVLIFNAPLPSLYVLSFLDHGMPISLTCRQVQHERGRAILHFDEPGGLKVVERRFVTADDRFVSELEITNGAKVDRDITVVMWSVTDPEGEPVSLEGDGYRIRRLLKTSNYPEVPSDIHFTSPDSKGARCLQGFFAEGGSDRPDFEETPWFDMAALPTPRAKRPMEKPSPILPGSRVYCGLFRPVPLKAGGKAAHRFEANVIFKGKGITFRARRPDPKDETGWAAFWDKVPKFQCDWKELERVVRHRFELLYLLRVPHGAGLFHSPAVCEGNGPFHQPTSFSTPAIMREARWLQDPVLARGCLKLFFDNVLHHGQAPGRVYMTGLENSDFYHADWGGGFESLDAIHSDRATKKAVLMAMQRYVKWLANNRDPEGSGITDIVNHFEAGQEFSRRYTVIDDKADRALEFTEQFRLKGIDASVFRYRMVKWLHKVADEIQEKAMANRFHAEAEVIQDTIRRKMWDEKAGIFMDLDPEDRKKTNVKAAVGFYPLATDIPNAKMVERMLDTLSDRKEFWTRYPVPSLSISDPFYDATGRWKGTRKNCPWNGRVWPMINSHVLEGLTHWAERGNKRAQKLAGELLKKTVAMMSGLAEGSQDANSFEHYHPETGLGSRYRGVQLYLHAFLLDNIFRIAGGFAIRYGEIQDDPIGEPMDFKLQGMPLGNKIYDVERKNGKLRVNHQ